MLKRRSPTDESPPPLPVAASADTHPSPPRRLRRGYIYARVNPLATRHGCLAYACLLPLLA